MTRFQARTKSFTRRARAIPDNLQRTMQTYGERYVIEVPRAEGLTTVAEDFQFSADSAFGRAAPLVLEIGSGVGEQIVTAAGRDPERNYLALEVWQPGIAKTVSKAVEEGVSNLRIIEADAQQALPILFSAGSISEMWTFFPDPWRKARHRKRRLVSGSFLDTVATVLAAGAPWRLATDWEDYADQMREEIAGCDQFILEEASRWDGRVLTRFEQRGRDAGRQVWDFTAWRR